MGKRISFDLGTTSIGWAVFEAEGNIATKLLDAGVRVFEEPRDPKTKESNAVARRKARALRRQIRRRVTRRKLVVKLFKKYGWIPSVSAAPYGFSNNPYKLRADALSRKLNPLELAEVLFNIAKRRGFKSNRKLDRKSSDSNLITEEAGQIKSEMERLGHRTLGEHLSFLYEKKPLERIRCKKTLRQMYIDEFDLVIKNQVRFAFDGLDEAMIEELKRVIFWQLPFELQPEKRLKTLGKCPLVEGERRAYVYDPVAIEFRIRKTVNNLKLIDQRNGNSRALSADEREEIVFALFESQKETFSKLKKIIGVLDTELFNLETERTDHIKGDPYYSFLAKHLKKRYKRELFEEVQALCEISHNAGSSEEVFKLGNAACPSLNLSKEDASYIFNEFPLGADGTSAYSRRAMESAIPLMKEGLNEFEAIAKVFPPKENQEVYDLLPLPEEKITNPTVNRAVHQLRRVYNALVKIHGKPETVVVELAKEIALPKWKKDEMSKMQKQREKQNSRLAEEVKGAGLEPSKDLILRLELAESQGMVCPYTGKSFGKADVFAEGKLEIDHILPFSKSLDDSKGNLVLVFAKSNADKGNRTPGEWLKGAEHTQMIERVSKMAFSFSKKKKFYQDAKADVDTFISQQLNDTRYISKFVRDYIGKSFHSKDRASKIQSLRGSHTGWIRKLWGLNQFLGDSPEKNRNDLRHHAIDAIVAGLSNPKNLKRLAEVRGGYGTHFQLPIPYPSLHAEIKTVLNSMIVSKMQSKKMSGPFHAETSYSPPKQSDKKGYVRVVHRVGVDRITLPQVKNIVDPVIKALVFKRLEEVGGKDLDESKIKALLKDGALIGMTMKSGVPVKRIRVEDVFKETTINVSRDPHSGAPYRTTVNDGNYCISIVPSGLAKKGDKAVISSIKNALDGKISSLDSKLTLHKGDSVMVKNFGLGYVRKISTTASDGPYVEIDKDSVGLILKENIDKDFKRYQAAGKLLDEVSLMVVSVLGKK